MIRFLGISIARALGVALAVTYWCCNYCGVFVVVLLSPAGLILVPDRVREWRFWRQDAVAAVWFLLLAGPLVQGQLYGELRTVVPGYSKIRSLYRFAVFMQLGCVFLGVLFLQLAVELIPSIHPSIQRSRLRTATLTLVTLFFGFSITERWPEVPQLTRVPWNDSEPDRCRFLRQQTPDDTPLACFPFPTDKQAADYEPQTHWMLASSWHHRSIVNGYSGYLPQSYGRIKAAALNGPDAECLALLRENGVLCCVPNESWIEKPPLDLQQFEDNPELKRVFADPAHGISVYQLISAETEN